MSVLYLDELAVFETESIIVKLQYLNKVGPDDSDYLSTATDNVRGDTLLITTKNKEHYNGPWFISEHLMDILEYMEHDSSSNDTFGVIPPTDPSWFENCDWVYEAEYHSHDRPSCVFCGEYGKRSPDLYCDLPNRNMSSNGWTHPRFSFQKYRNKYIHEDCLVYIAGAVEKLQKENPADFLVRTI